MGANRGSYGAALRTTLTNTAAAYGYTLSTATTLTMLMVVEGKPNVGKLFLFTLGGVAAFALVEVLVKLLSGGEGGPASQAFPVAGALSVLAVPAALGAATGIAQALSSPLAWLLAPMGSTASYLLLLAVQASIVAAWQRKR